MTPLSRTILEQYQVRKTKKQKAAFIDLLRQHFPDLQLQEGSFPKCRNIIIGDVENAKIVLTAHYDTCTTMLLPNFIMPKNPVVSILYGILTVLPFLLVLFLLDSLLVRVFQNPLLLYWLSLAAYVGMVSLMIFGPANKHTANDNTSGVVTLCELLSTLSDQQKEKLAFVFFDHEETGLIGSSFFRSKYKKQMENKLLINLDCVSDGDYILLAVSKLARDEYADAVDAAFQPTETKNVLITKAEKVYYPSDQLGFKRNIAIAALKRHRLLGYYMDRIHTNRDTVFDESNICYICEGVKKLIEQA